ncbi:MAG: isoprenylcysteine carboxylmethyltransferase family protein [Acidimicrobiia bacterium]
MTFSERGGWWVIAQLGLFAVYVYALVGTDSLTEGFGLGFARITGVVTLVIGIGIGAWSMVILGKDLTIFPHPMEETRLVDHGPYRLVRHPIYFGVILGAVGLALAFASPAAVIVSLVFVPFFMAKTGFEEDRLVENVPGYREYRSAIPYRIIPRVM